MAHLRLKFVNTFRDRHGRQRHYFRRPGCKAVALAGDVGSAEFTLAYQAALGGEPLRPEIGASRNQAGTIASWVALYLKSDTFTKELAPTTQGMRRAILERFRVSHGDKRGALLQRAHIAALLKPMAPYAQKNYLKTLRGLMAFAVAERWRTDDPTDGLRTVKVGKSRGHMTWGDEQIAQYRERHALGTVARLALELLLNIAARRHDAHVIGRQHLRDGKLCWRPNKTRRSTGKMLKVRVLPDLQAALDAMPTNDSLAFLVNDYGKPFASAAAFGNKFADWCDDSGLPEVECDDGRVRNYRAHGLRKAACRMLAHAGCTAPEIMAVSGHATLAQVQVYIDEVDGERMADAALDKLAGTEKATATYKPSSPKLQTGS